MDSHDEDLKKPVLLCSPLLILAITLIITLIVSKLLGGPPYLERISILAP